MLFMTMREKQFLGRTFLRWLTTVLMEYKGTTFNSFIKRFQAVFPFTIYCLLKSVTILCEI